MPEEDSQVFSWLLLWNCVEVWHQLRSSAAAAVVSASALKHACVDLNGLFTEGEYSQATNPKDKVTNQLLACLNTHQCVLNQVYQLSNMPV